MMFHKNTRTQVQTRTQIEKDQLVVFNGVIHQPETEVSPLGPPMESKLSPAVSNTLPSIHFGITLTANNFTSEAFMISIAGE